MMGIINEATFGDKSVGSVTTQYPAFVRNYDRPTDQQTDRTTDRLTDWTTEQPTNGHEAPCHS